MNEETKLLLTLPAELKKQFQLTCIRNDTNMSDCIRQLMQDYINQNQPEQ